MREENQLAEKCADSAEEVERGLMAFYRKNDGVDQKVRSYSFEAEVRDGQLWGMVVCKVREQLTPDELELLKEYITGQVSGGYEESTELQGIDVGGGREIYIHLWQKEGWSIMTEQDRFAPHISERLPDMCFSILRSTGALICIKRGESGYYPSDWDTGDPAQNRELMEYNNQRLGVTEAQRLAMEAGAMHGWNCPAAEPKTYERGPQQMGGMDLA